MPLDLDGLFQEGVDVGRAESAAEIAILRAQSDRFEEMLEEWMECAKYDALMDGPAFKGWDRSGLDRCLQRTRKALAKERE